MYNRVTLLGRITHDLELKSTANGVPVLSFSVACDRRYQQDKNNKVSDFFNCIAWRNEADFIAKYWTKGRAILIEGELQNRKYTDKNGIERQVTEVIVDRACFTGEKNPNSVPRDVPPPPEAPPERGKKNVVIDEAAPEQTQAPPPGDDDYPF